MTYTATTRFGKRLEARMEPWLDSKGDLARLIDAIGACFEPYLEIGEESGEDGTAGYVPAYGNLMDPNTCPGKDLPWLGQFVGVPVRQGATEAEARAEVKAESGTIRGTKASLEVLLKKALGATSFYILEREPSPYRLQIVIPAGKLTNAVYEEINLTIPAGILYQVIEQANAFAAGGKKWSEIAAGKTWATIVEGEY